MTSETNSVLEHRGELVLPPYETCGNPPPSPLYNNEVIRKEVAADGKGIPWWEWYMIGRAYRRHGSVDNYFAENPFNFGGMTVTEYVNYYATERLAGIHPKKIKMSGKQKRHAETVINYLERYHQPVPVEQIYWSSGFMPDEFVGKGIGEVVRANRVVRAEAESARITNHLSIGKDDTAYNDGKDLIYPNGCIVIIRDAYGCPEPQNWYSSEYVLPMGSKFYIVDMYQANITHSFVLYKDITVIEVQMLPVHKQCGKTGNVTGPFKISVISDGRYIEASSDGTEAGTVFTGDEEYINRVKKNIAFGRKGTIIDDRSAMLVESGYESPVALAAALFSVSPLYTHLQYAPDEVYEFFGWKNTNATGVIVEAPPAPRDRFTITVEVGHEGAVLQAVSDGTGAGTELTGSEDHIRRVRKAIRLQSLVDIVGTQHSPAIKSGYENPLALTAALYSIAPRYTNIVEAPDEVMDLFKRYPPKNCFPSKD